MRAGVSADDTRLRLRANLSTAKITRNPREPGGIPIWAASSAVMMHGRCLALEPR